MMRKGTSHVDWAISMGIFLVYILLTFIFLKPATEPTYSGNSLLDIVYKGLKDDASYTIKKGYLKITPTDDIVENKEYTLRIRCLDKSPSYGPDCLSASGMEMDWVESEKDQNIIEKGRHLTLVNESLGKVCCEDMLAVQFDFKDESTPSRNWHVLEIKTNLKEGENVFWFLYSEDFNYSSHLTVDTTVLADNLCVKRTPPLTGPKDNDCLLADGEISSPCTPGLGSPACFQDKTNFTYQFGVVESQTAFSEEKFDRLKVNYDNQYEALKEKWGIPEGVQFTVNIKSLSSYPIDYEFGAIGEVPENVDVFVKELGDWVLQEKATYLPVKISVKVWLSTISKAPPEMPPEMPPAMPTELFLIKNTGGDTVAIFDNQGNLKLDGTCSFGSTCNPIGYSFKIENNAGDVVAYIDENGNLCLESDDCSDHDESCDTSTDGLFVQNSLGTTVAYIDTSGQLCLKGSLIQGAGS